MLYLCDRQGLIGRERFAIDGVKLPSNASKSRSGTRAEFAKRAAKLEKVVEKMLARHRANDAAPVEPAPDDKAAQRVARLGKQAAQIRQWLAEHPEDRNGSGCVISGYAVVKFTGAQRACVPCGDAAAVCAIRRRPRRARWRSSRARL